MRPLVTNSNKTNWNVNNIYWNNIYMKKYEDYFHLNGKCNSTHQNSLEYLKYFTLFKMIGNRKYENVFLEVSRLTNSMFTEFQMYTFQLQRFIFIETPVDLLF